MSTTPTNNFKTYAHLRNPNTARRVSSRSRLRTNTNPTLLEVHPQPELSHKILIVGGKKCGKTSLARFYAEHLPTQTYSQTIGSDIYVTPHGVLCGRQVYLKLVDVGHAEVHGSPSFLSLTTADTAGVLLMFDVANPHSFQELDAWTATLRSYIPSLGTRVPVLVLAHKADRLQNRTTVQHIKASDLDRYVHANQFTGWRWSTTHVPNMHPTTTAPNATTAPASSSNRLARSISDAVHSLVEAILVSAAEYYSKTSTSLLDQPSANDRAHRGTLEQLLNGTHQSATYVCIPQAAQPGDSKVAAGAALCSPTPKHQVEVLPTVVLVLGTGGIDGIDELEQLKRTQDMYTTIELKLKQMKHQLGNEQSRVVVKGFDKIDRHIDHLIDRCRREASTVGGENEGMVDGGAQWRIVLREMEELLP